EQVDAAVVLIVLDALDEAVVVELRDGHVADAGNGHPEVGFLPVFLYKGAHLLLELKARGLGDRELRLQVLWNVQAPLVERRTGGDAVNGELVEGHLAKLAPIAVEAGGAGIPHAAALGCFLCGGSWQWRL